MLTSFASCLWRSWLAFFSVGRKSSTLERADRHHDRVRSSFTISFSFLRTRHGEREEERGDLRFAVVWRSETFSKSLGEVAYRAQREVDDHRAPVASRPSSSHHLSSVL